MDEPINYQSSRNGPLKPEIAQRLDDLRVFNRLTYKMLADELGVSIAFAHNIINKAACISTTTTMPRIARGIDRLIASETRTHNLQAAALIQREMREHTYHLRDNMVVKMTLPQDLTGRESEKLALFLRSIAD